MAYKVFFVEDEIVIREGIRDNVDWQADGFELCGEAPDGEIALPLLQAIQPDVLITDIKMPFMDGLQLSKVVRERMPRTKVVILSGHDEFEYAQEAIKLGITEYLLKPVTIQDLHKVMQKLAGQLTREENERANLLKLQEQMQENHAVLVERLLLNLLVGTITTAEAIEQSKLLGLDLIARAYVVVVIQIALNDTGAPNDYQEFQHAQEIVLSLTSQNPDVFLLRKDIEELVLIVKGDTPNCLKEDLDLMLEQIGRQMLATRCILSIGVGVSAHQITDIGRSFVEALAKAQATSSGMHTDSDGGAETADLLKVDKSAVQDYLKCGVKEDFDDFFTSFLLPLGKSAFKSSLVKNYVLLDLVFAAARFVQQLGGSIEDVMPELEQIESVVANIQMIEQVRELAQRILTNALAFRDTATHSLRAGMIQWAKEYLDQHYMDSEISLQDVAAQVGHSPCHFSTVFSKETGQTFKAYLTELRIKRAKELIRTTALRTSEISDRVGYNDAHYFSIVFRNSTGLSPKDYRLQAQRAEK